MTKSEIDAMTARMYLGSYAEASSLGSYILKNEEKISIGITDEESALLSYLYLNEEVSAEKLAVLFPSTGSRRHLLNLEARGLIRFSSNQVVLLRPYGLSLHPLFGERTEEERKNYRQEDFPRALVSYLLKEGREAKKVEGAYLTRQERCRQMFPFMDELAISELLDYLKESIERLQINPKTRKGYQRLLEFYSLSYEEMLSYLLWPELEKEERKRSLVFFSILKRSGAVEEGGFKVVFDLAQKLSGFNLAQLKDLERYARRMEAFIRTCFFEERDEVFFPLRNKEEDKEGEIVIGSDQSITSYGRTDSRLYVIAEPVKIDNSKLFELTKESARRYFRLGFSKDDMMEMLKTLSRFPIPDMISTLLDFWYEEYMRIRVTRNLVVRVSPDISARLERQLSGYVEEKIGENCFLLNLADEQELTTILSQYRIDIEGEKLELEKERTIPELESMTIEEVSVDLPEKRRYAYKQNRKEELLAKLKDEDKATRTLKMMMIQSGFLFDESQLSNPLPFVQADAYHYMDKYRILMQAQKDKDCCVQVENHSGQSAIGGVSLVQGYEEGDHTIVGRKMLSISRLYRIRLIPKAFL